MLPKEIIYAPVHCPPHYPTHCPLWHEQHFSWDRPFQLFLFEIFHSLKPTAVMSQWPVNQNLQKFPCAPEIRVSISELSFSLQILTGEYICFPSYSHHIRAFFFLHIVKPAFSAFVHSLLFIFLRIFEHELKSSLTIEGKKSKIIIIFIY